MNMTPSLHVLCHSGTPRGGVGKLLVHRKCQEGPSFMFSTASPETKELLGDTVQHLRFQARQGIIGGT